MNKIKMLKKFILFMVLIQMSEVLVIAQDHGGYPVDREIRQISIIKGDRVYTFMIIFKSRYYISWSEDPHDKGFNGLGLADNRQCRYKLLVETDMSNPCAIDERPITELPVNDNLTFTCSKELRRVDSWTIAEHEFNNSENCNEKMSQIIGAYESKYDEGTKSAKNTVNYLIDKFAIEFKAMK